MLPVARTFVNMSNGGYDYKFVEQCVSTPLDRYLCVICQHPSRDPRLSVCCGHVFCKSCIENVKHPCPMCRDENFVTFPNKQLDREIKNLNIICANVERGCTWQGKLGDIGDHLGNNCQFEEVRCTNKCEKTIQRMYLTAHIGDECPRRQVTCQYCDNTGEHQFIEGEHKEECPRFPIPCPNKCDVQTVPREDMETHRKKCPLEMIQCEYHSVGCETRMLRVNKQMHEEQNKDKHLMLTKDKLVDALQQISALSILVHQNKLMNMAGLFETGRQICPVIVKVSEYNKKVKDDDEYWTASFYTHDEGYKMCAEVHPAGYDDGIGTHLSLFLHVMKGSYDDELTWPLKGTFDIKLLNQLSDSEHLAVAITFDDSTKEHGSRVTTKDQITTGWGQTYHLISNEDLHKTTPTCLQHLGLFLSCIDIMLTFANQFNQLDTYHTFDFQTSR